MPGGACMPGEGEGHAGGNKRQIMNSDNERINLKQKSKTLTNMLRSTGTYGTVVNSSNQSSTYYIIIIYYFGPFGHYHFELRKSYTII